MSRLTIPTTDRVTSVLDGLYAQVERRINASQQGICPTDMSAAFLSLCAAQSCGKCVPCRVGLPQMNNLMQEILNGDGSEETLTLLEKTANGVAVSADCTIGAGAAEIVLTSVKAFREDYQSHIQHGQCLTNGDAVPCVEMCPAHVDIPGYISLINEGRHRDAVRLICKDNPFPSACGLICEHPCEERCRRRMVDAPLNIRGLKRYAVVNGGDIEPPANMEKTGKRIAMIGGGPSSLTAAYFLSLMGHEVEVFEKRKHLGGMLRYGIPSYRLPRALLMRDIDMILKTGVKVHTEVNIGAGEALTFEKLAEDFDCVYIAIGAHTDKKMRIEGENARGVMSSVDFLRGIGDEIMPDLTGKKVVIVGGGNVAMDAARSCIRSGAEKVTIAYRRSRSDMPALVEEVDEAVEEGCELLAMMAPLRVETNDQDEVVAFHVQPQITGAIGSDGRPSVRKADADPIRIPCDLIITGIGQAIESEDFGAAGLPLKWDTIDASMTCEIEGKPGIFSGGDCVSGPSTVIRAIAAGKAAAANIDQYLGFDHKISFDFDIPNAKIWDREPCGRVNLTIREVAGRIDDFDHIENSMSDEEAAQESGRCLRCDHFGYGAFREGRQYAW